ncbi:MAG: protein-L-isoaspartate O-methyltransferase, partial [Alphaproteobacteria bacterium]|nr:protein-L-isoaspartate O-methyltransferase [Alphaproteobacteria bacterium]
MAKPKTVSPDDRLWERARRKLLTQIDADFAATGDYTGRARVNPLIRLAMARVPRHLFVPPGEEFLAYEDHALAIGYGQTIS